jgi:hypothetical protein
VIEFCQGHGCRHKAELISQGNPENVKRSLCSSISVHVIQIAGRPFACLSSIKTLASSNRGKSSELRPLQPDSSEFLGNVIASSRTPVTAGKEIELPELSQDC